MAARNVDQINIGNWQQTGNTVRVDQYSVDIEANWTGDDGTKYSYGPETHLWPNVLADVPLPALREFMQQMILAKVRVMLGIDDWDNYS